MQTEVKASHTKVVDKPEAASMQQHAASMDIKQADQLTEKEMDEPSMPIN